MRPLSIFEIVAGSLFAIGGLVSAFRTFARIEPGDSTRIRMLIVLHATAKGGFWFGIGGVFVAYALAEQPQGLQLLLAIPLVMAGVRLITAQALDRALPPE